jgi:pimeloyl-ACP methyl ester carboxylesterase
MADYLRRVDQFTNIGYNVVIFDYRGYGESSEFEIDNNMYIYPHFTDDLESMIDYVRKNHVAHFDIYGWGIGAGLSFGIGYNRIEIKKIIADTPFLSMEDLEERFSSWDEPMEVPFAGYEKRFEPIYAVENPPVSNRAGKEIFLVIGSNDILFNEKDMDVLKRKCTLELGIYVVENPDRKDNFRVDKAAYMKKVSAFLNK